MSEKGFGGRFFDAGPRRRGLHFAFHFRAGSVGRLDGLIALAAFGALNSLGFVFSPARNAVFARVMQMQTVPPEIASQMQNQLMHIIVPVSMSGGAVISLIVLYFLITRRRAFRAACGKQ